MYTVTVHMLLTIIYGFFKHGSFNYLHQQDEGCAQQYIRVLDFKNRFIRMRICNKIGKTYASGHSLVGEFNYQVQNQDIVMFLRLAVTGGRAWSGLMTRRGLAKHRGVSQFDVGGHKFTIQDTDVGKYPSSSLYQMAQTPEQEVQINRSGSLFKHVYMYLQYGQLPRGVDGKVMMDDQTLKELNAEADYYGLDRLSAECNLARQSTIGPDFQSYFSVSDYICDVLGEHFDMRRVLTDFYLAPVPPLSLALKCLWVPFCAVEEQLWHKKKLQYSLTDAVAAPFLSAINDTQNYSMDVSMLNASVLDAILFKINDDSALKDFAPHLDLTLHPKCLVVQKEGFSQEQSSVLQSTNHTGLIGKLVVILNSEYTGGELEVTHGHHTEVVTGPYNWVAMYGDCLDKINPVTSGTRVSLICEIHGENRDLREEDKEICFPRDKWLYRSRAKSADLVSTRRPLSAKQQLNILRCLEKEMQRRDSIVVGLQHQYHYNNLRQMPTVEMLRGGDKVLYEILINSGDYEVKLISFTVQYTDGSCSRRPTVKLFSFDIMNSDTPRCSTNDTIEDSEMGDGDKKPTRGTAVVMPSVVNSKWILSSELLDDGDYGCRNESVYLVSGLQISKRNG